MGYTHYWYRKVGEDHNQKEWNTFGVQALRIVNKSEIPLGDWDGENRPIFNFDRIELNGIGEDGHEPLILHREVPEQPSYRADEPDYFEFCKTACKPYDLVVTAILLLYKHYFPTVKVSSDGDVENWKDG